MFCFLRTNTFLNTKELLWCHKAVAHSHCAQHCFTFGISWDQSDIIYSCMDLTLRVETKFLYENILSALSSSIFKSLWLQPQANRWRHAVKGITYNNLQRHNNKIDPNIYPPCSITSTIAHRQTVGHKTCRPRYGVYRTPMKSLRSLPAEGRGARGNCTVSPRFKDGDVKAGSNGDIVNKLYDLYWSLITFTQINTLCLDTRFISLLNYWNGDRLQRIYLLFLFYTYI